MSHEGSVEKHVTGDPEQTWRILGLVNDWIRHAETKSAGTLAAAGVEAGVFYNLVKDVSEPGWLLWVVGAPCVLLIVTGGAFASWALRPRLWSGEAPTSNLYFDHIARGHPKPTKGAEYLQALHGLTSDNQALVDEIAAQVWANAHVATSKFKWGNFGLTCVLGALPLLAVTALIVAIKTHA